MLIRSIFTFLFRYSFPQQTRVREANVLLWRREKGFNDYDAYDYAAYVVDSGSWVFDSAVPVSP